MWSSPPFLGRRPKAVAGPSASDPSVINFCDITSIFTIFRALAGPGFLFFIRLFGFRVQEREERGGVVVCVPSVSRSGSTIEDLIFFPSGITILTSNWKWSVYLPFASKCDC